MQPDDEQRIQRERCEKAQQIGEMLRQIGDNEQRRIEGHMRERNERENKEGEEEKDLRERAKRIGEILREIGDKEDSRRT